MRCLGFDGRVKVPAPAWLSAVMRSAGSNLDSARRNRSTPKWAAIRVIRMRKWAARLAHVANWLPIKFQNTNDIIRAKAPADPRHYLPDVSACPLELTPTNLP